jgi:hypothetical protein
VRMSSCDARGDAGRSALSGKVLPDLAAPLAPPAVGGLGSRFWALVEEESDSGDEGYAGSEQSVGENQGGSPRSSPVQRMLGDFLDPDWMVVAPEGRRRGGKRTSFAPGGRCAGFSARAASFLECRTPAVPSASDFLPLPAPAAVGACPSVLGCEFKVGSLLIPLSVSPDPVAGQVAAGLGTEQRRSPACGDVDAARPLVDAVGVAPAGQSQLHQRDAALDASGPSVF